MGKNVRINDDLHRQVKELAARERRSINIMSEILIAHSLNEGYTTIGRPMKTVHSDGRVEYGLVPKPRDDKVGGNESYGAGV